MSLLSDLPIGLEDCPAPGEFRTPVLYPMEDERPEKACAVIFKMVIREIRMKTE